MIKFCPICQQNNSTEWGCMSGYFWGFKDEVSACPIDNTLLINIDFPASDLRDLGSISETKQFIEAMIDLYQKDIIEYELKMSQFRTQLEQKQSNQTDNQIKCPKCHSTAITTGARGLNWTMGFIGASKTVNRCANCGHTWKPKR